MNAKRLPPTGDAEMWVITDKAGKEHRVIITNAQMACSPNAVKLALRRAAYKYNRVQPHG